MDSPGRTLSGWRATTVIVTEMDEELVVRLRLAARLLVSVALCCFLNVPSEAVRAETMPVYVSILPLKHFVERVGGKQVRVAVMVGPGQSPATYEPSPKQMAALAEARVYFRIGVPFEDVWLERLVAANPMLRMVDVRTGVTLRTFKVDAAARHYSHFGEQRSHNGAGHHDPHVWTDPRRVTIMAGNIRDTLIALDPAHRAEYQANHAEFADELARLDQAIRQLFADKKARWFMVFHPAWGYFAEAYELQQIPIETAGKEPGAKKLAQLIDDAKALNIRTIFVQSQFGRRNAETVARAIDGRVIAVDPLAENYAENLLLVAKTVAEAIE